MFQIIATIASDESTAWATWVYAIATCVYALATLAIAGVAYRGTKAWRQELSTKASFEVARDLLTKLLRLRDEVRAVRSPLFQEFHNRPGRKVKEMDFPLDAADETYVIENRVQKLLDSKRAVDTVLVEASAMWGPELSDDAKQLDSIVSRVQFSLLSLLMRVGRRPQTVAEELEVKKSIPVAFSQLDLTAADEVAKELQAIMTSFEKKLKPYLGRKHGKF